MLIFHRGFSEGFDGPGTRLIFYCKGCNFHCDWCASPESISPAREILFHPDRGTAGIERCCPKHALSAAGPDRSVCRKCGDFACAALWRHPAVELAGQEISTARIVALAEDARELIRGVTFGGGEPSLQADAVLEALTALRERGFHTAIESNASTEAYRRLVGAADWLFSDLKTLDPEIARKRIGPGIDVEKVAANLRFAAADQHDFTVRIPVVSGVNDAPEAQRQMTEFLHGLLALRSEGHLRVELLRQHHLGEPKYRSLGAVYKLKDTALPEKQVLTDWAAELCRAGLDAVVFA